MKTRLTLLLCVVGVSGYAQSPGRFIAAGNMTTPRMLHTATLLADGRVLIAGGEMIVGTGRNIGSGLSFQILASAELYDPSTGVFAPTGDMTTSRIGHSATLLPDGKVLIAGGAGTSAELYDPATGAFSATGNMTTGRGNATTTLLANGKVLLAGGGYNAAGVPNASAELYDPSTGAFTATGDMTADWADTATLLPNGMVLITRGAPEEIPLFLAEVYDPSTGLFSPTGKTLTTDSGPTATLLTSGKVLVAGGAIGDGDGISSSAELYDPVTGTFAFTANLTAGRDQSTATLVPDGTVLMAGGHNLISLATTAEIYDPVNGIFTVTGSMAGIRELHTATLLQDGRVLIAGGDDERYWIPETILSSAELYTPTVLVPAPMLLSLSGDGKGQGMIQHAGTNRIASAGDPAVAGEVLSIYLTGLTDGNVIPPQVAIGGRSAEIAFFGNVPGNPGLNVVNVRMPDGVAPGPAVRVRLTYVGRLSNEVTIGAAGPAGSAVITSPTPGSTLTSSGITFQWTAGSGTSGSYWIRVGTAGVGSYDVSAAIYTGTSATISSLPTNGGPIYVRLYSQNASTGDWVFIDYTYTAASGGSSFTAATMTSPTPGSTLSDSAATFQWTVGTGSSGSYWIRVGTTGVGSYDVFFDLYGSTSAAISGLPTNGGTLYVRLYSQNASTGVWVFNDYTYTAASGGSSSSFTAATMTSPTPGSTLSDSAATFQWTVGTGSSGSYWIRVGTTGVGSYDVFFDLYGSTSAAISGLPINGGTLYVRLYSQNASTGVWVFNDYTYTAP